MYPIGGILEFNDRRCSGIMRIDLPAIFWEDFPRIYLTFKYYGRK